MQGKISSWLLFQASKRKIGPYKTIKKIGENAYMVDLPKHMVIESTFNISDLYLYIGENVKEVSINTKLEYELLLRRREWCSH